MIWHVLTIWILNRFGIQIATVTDLISRKSGHVRISNGRPLSRIGMVQFSNGFEKLVAILSDFQMVQSKFWMVSSYSPTLQILDNSKFNLHKVQFLNDSDFWRVGFRFPLCYGWVENHPLLKNSQEYLR